MAQIINVPGPQSSCDVTTKGQGSCMVIATWSRGLGRCREFHNAGELPPCAEIDATMYILQCVAVAVQFVVHLLGSMSYNESSNPMQTELTEVGLNGSFSLSVCSAGAQTRL